MCDLFIHVGHRRTATTWMQEVLFRGSPNIHFIAKHRRNYPDWLIQWHYLDDFSFERKKHSIRGQLLEQLINDRPNLLSSEAFTNTGVIFSQAHRIKQIFPTAKIILTLRDPIDLIQSHYCYDIDKEGIFCDLEDYIDWRRTPFVIGKRRPIYLPDFFFNETIELYEKLFGKGNLCILKYEDFVDNPQKFFQSLEKFIGTELQWDQKKLSFHLNKRLEDEKVKEKKIQNLTHFLEKSRSNLYCDVYILEMGEDLTSQVLSSELRKKLETYFNDRSFGYY